MVQKTKIIATITSSLACFPKKHCLWKNLGSADRMKLNAAFLGAKSLKT